MSTLDKSPVAPLAPKITDMTEQQLAESINTKHSMVLNSFRSSVAYAMDVGDLLVEAKKRVGHGNFEGWVNDHCKFSYRSAARYMGMAKNRTKLEAQLNSKSATLADLNAQKLLTSGGGGGAEVAKRTLSVR